MLLRRLLIVCVALCLGLALAPTALACPETARNTVFQAWGDDAEYSGVPEEAFTGDGALTETSTLRLGTGTTATTPALCINKYTPRLRFTFRALARDAHLKVHVLYTGSDGKPKTDQIADYDPGKYPDWALSQSLSFRGAVPGDASDREVRVRFSVDDKNTGGWELDDVSYAVSEAPVCPPVEYAQVFSPWGDGGDYKPVPGGSFEQDGGWHAGDQTTVVEEANPFEVSGQSLRSYRLGGFGELVSPPVCVNRYHPHMRFVLRALEPGARLKVEALWTADDGKAKQTDLAHFEADRHYGWGLSKQVRLKSALPKEERVRDLRLRFWVDGGAGGWLIDDIYVDPYKR